MGQSTGNLIIEGVMLNQDTPWSNIFFINYHLSPPQEQLLWERGDRAIISDGGKKDLKDNYRTSGLTLWDGVEKFKIAQQNFSS